MRSAAVNSDVRIGPFGVLSELFLFHGITPAPYLFFDKTCFKIDPALYRPNDPADFQTRGTRGGDWICVRLLRLRSRSQGRLALIKQVNIIISQIASGRLYFPEVSSRIDEVETHFTPELSSRP